MRLRRAALTLSLLLAASAGAATYEEDVARYVAIFEGDFLSHNNASESLAWMGLSDPRLFDVIERRVLEEHVAARREGTHKDRVARYIRALGFSGQAKYEKTLRRMAADKGYSRHADQALEDLPHWAKWNALISDRSTFVPELDDEANRVVNMLRAEDLLLKRVGAKRVYFSVRDAAVLAVLAAQVRQHYLMSDHNADDDDAVDSVAWLVKALASTQSDEFLPLLVEISGSDAPRKVRSWANNELNRRNKLNWKPDQG